MPLEQKKRILVVEDEEPLAKALEKDLTKAGFEVICSLDGTETVHLLQRETFDLILLDILMPEVNGFDILDILQRSRSTTPVIVLTNLGEEEDKVYTSRLGAVDYLIKAHTPLATVVERVKEALYAK